ncbi:HicA-like toxin [Gordonia phage Phabuloso]|nr:HicA-like toxin [Gordonia phage Phabuloso]
MPVEWPAHKATYVLTLLCVELGYEKTRAGSGSKIVLTADGLPTIPWDYTKKQKVSPRALRTLLLVTIGLPEDQAADLLTRKPGRSRARSRQVGGTYIAREPPDFLSSMEQLPGRVPKTWRDANGRLFQYDSLHGNIEGYNKRGKHIGVFHVDTGERVGPGVRGRSISV